MAKQIFVNLPVKDVKKSREFFSKLGFTFNEQFSDEKALCMVINEGSIYAMFLNDDYFQTFTAKPVSDAAKSTEVLIALDAESREEVENIIKKAVDAGGSTYKEPQDHGWMYQHAFADLDGHQWEIIYMDESAIPQG